jgi:hypothetical protein
MKLIIHIGLHKTGTSAIQQNFLQGKSGYLGKIKNQRNQTADEVQELAELATHYLFADKAQFAERIERWLDRIEEIHATLKPDIAIKISEEGISNWMEVPDERLRWPIRYGIAAHFKYKPRTGDLPFATFLKDVLGPSVKRRGGKIKIVLTLRNQLQWLASFYSQASNRIPFACQKNFEKQVKDLTATNDPILDYFKLAKSLEETVGRDNLAILFQEEMHTESFWQKAKIEFECFDARFHTSTFNRKNVRRTAGTSWALFAKHRRLDFRLRPSKTGEIHLTEKLVADIQSTCSVSNHKLAEFVGVDIAQYGYCESGS